MANFNPNPNRKSLIMLKTEHVLAHLSSKNNNGNGVGGSSMGIYELNEEMRNDFAENYQQLNPLLHRQSVMSAGGGSFFPAGSSGGPPSVAPPSVNNAAEIRYPDFDQWLTTAGNISYVTSVMLARSKSESTLSEMSDMTNSRRRLFSISKKPQRRSRLNYHDLGKSELRDGIRQHHVALLRWTSLVGRLSKQLSSAFSEFSKKLELTATELRLETEKTNRMFRNENVKNQKPTFILGRTLDKIWLTVLDNVSDQARIFGDLSKTMTLDFAPSFTELIDHHQKFIGQIYAFECGLEQLLGEYKHTTDKSYEAAELAKSLALSPVDPKLMPRSGLGSLPFAVDAQNAYVLHLHNYNTMCGQYETQLMPVLVEEMEEASTDLMTYGVKFLDAITQLIGKRYGELKGRMEVVEFACRYQSKARSDISAYVRAYLEGKRSATGSHVTTFVPIPVTPKNQLLAVDDNEHKLADAMDMITEEIYDMADLRRSKQIELEKLEERYHQCLANANHMATSGTTGSGANGQDQQSKNQNKGQSSSVVKEALPNFSTVTFTLKENIADARRMIALATAKLNSLKHQMDLLSATRRQTSGQEEMRRPSTGGRPPRLPHQSSVAGGKSSGSKGGGLRRSLTQWFSFLTLSNGGQPGGLASSSRNKSAPHSASVAALSVSGDRRSQDDEDEDDEGGGDDDEAEYQHQRRGKYEDDDDDDDDDDPYYKRRSAPVRNSRQIEDDDEAEYYNDQLAEGADPNEELGAAAEQAKQKTKIFSVKGFKKTIDKLRRIASEDPPSSKPRRRRRAHGPHEPDPVYALLKCAARLSNVNLEAHAGNCTCDECPARRLVNGLTPAMALPTTLALSLPTSFQGSSEHSSLSYHPQPRQPHQQQQQQHQQQQPQNSFLGVDHPSVWTLGSGSRPERHRLSSASDANKSRSGASSTSPSSTNPPNNASQPQLQPSRSSATHLTSSTSATAAYYQQRR